jgi:SAM-dependent methyltransferase
VDHSARSALIKELGLEAGYRVIRFTTGSEHLHYGRFEPDVPRDFAHLKAAQDRYLERLVELIPPGVRTILDVGAGSGRTAELLLERGYEVDCVIPGGGLAEIAEARLGTRAGIRRGRFEHVDIPGRYDLVLFSESFQYIPPATALTRSLALLNPGGHILIADFFSRAPQPRSPIRGGHDFTRWREEYARHPLDIVVEFDITEETAPLHDILQTLSSEVIAPLYEHGRLAAQARWPIAARIGGWIFRSDMKKFERSRLSNERTGAEFIRAKVYKIYLFRHRPNPA